MFDLGFDSVEIGPICNQTTLIGSNSSQNDELRKQQVTTELAKYNIKPFIRDEIITSISNNEILVNIQPSMTIVNNLPE